MAKHLSKSSVSPNDDKKVGKSLDWHRKSLDWFDTAKYPKSDDPQYWAKQLGVRFQLRNLLAIPEYRDRAIEDWYYIVTAHQKKPLYWPPVDLH
ncbi:MAG: hypothetical protein CMQ20_08950 [Gammaproteobacteria bacterium]|nr:hypothetical protein [Gammaproteobacteria bacterium]